MVYRSGVNPTGGRNRVDYVGVPPTYKTFSVGTLEAKHATYSCVFLLVPLNDFTFEESEKLTRLTLRNNYKGKE